MSCGDPSGDRCRAALENLYAVIDNELDSGDIGEIQRHLDECAPCLTEYDVERIIKKLVARSCTERAPEPLRARVLTTIRSVQITVTSTE